MSETCAMEQPDRESLARRAHMFSQHLLQYPFKSTVVEVANQIVNLQINNRSITSGEVEKILRLMREDLGDTPCISDTFDNRETLTLMEEMLRLLKRLSTD